LTADNKIVIFKTFALLNGFAKKTAAVPRKDLELAERRREEYLSSRR
jgi:phage-related protein